MMMTTARDKFMKGDRVRLSEWGIACMGYKATQEATVVGFSRDDANVRVIIDGKRNPERWSPIYWERMRPSL